MTTEELKAENEKIMKYLEKTYKLLQEVKDVMVFGQYDSAVELIDEFEEYYKIEIEGILK